MHTCSTVARRVIMPSSLFDGRTEAQQIEAAKKLLIDNGYIVREPITTKNSVTSPSKLVKFFYDRVGYYNPELKYLPSADNKRDLSIAKGFIASRTSKSVGRKRAIQECCDIIEVMLKYEPLLGLDFRIYSMRILGQEKLGWVTDKAVEMLNGLNAKVSADEDQKWFDRFYRYQENNVNSRLVGLANKRLGIEENDG